MREECPNCGLPVVSIEIKVAEQVATMRSCTGCDQRWWETDGLPVEPTELFAKRA